MNKINFRLLIIFLIMLFSGCAANMGHPDTPLGNLRSDIDLLVNDPAFASATWGVY
ncbi:MAG: hypothetical protein IH880_06585, partial [Candidatus Marinimicrobia bacterium]|nr:hypothetical protein [Candidatus Neomarinimicrobiota bacterium]